MGFEVEVKFHRADHAAIAGALLALGAEAGEAVEQEDVYLAHPSRDFKETGEAFRLRRDGQAHRLTYKGPKHAGPTKTREEVEVAFEGGAAAWAKMGRLLEALGFRPVASVRKSRRPFHLRRGGLALEVVLDRVAGLGDFAEVEALAEGSSLAGAQAGVLALARELGLEDVEPRSYLRMILERGVGNPSGQA